MAMLSIDGGERWSMARCRSRRREHDGVAPRRCRCRPSRPPGLPCHPDVQHDAFALLIVLAIAQPAEPPRCDGARSCAPHTCRPRALRTAGWTGPRRARPRDSGGWLERRRIATEPRPSRTSRDARGPRLDRTAPRWRTGRPRAGSTDRAIATLPGRPGARMRRLGRARHSAARTTRRRVSRASPSAAWCSVPATAQPAIMAIMAIIIATNGRAKGVKRAAIATTIAGVRLCTSPRLRMNWSRVRQPSATRASPLRRPRRTMAAATRTAMERVDRRQHRTMWCTARLPIGRQRGATASRMRTGERRRYERRVQRRAGLGLTAVQRVNEPFRRVSLDTEIDARLRDNSFEAKVLGAAPRPCHRMAASLTAVRPR